MDKLLEIKALKVMFSTHDGLLKAVENIDIEIKKGECCAIVGESGCGKSVTGHAIMKLLDTPPAIYTAEAINYYGNSEQAESFSILNATEKDMFKIRGKEISMVFQDSAAALNPVLSIGRQVDEAFIQHKNLTKKQAKKATIELLTKVGVPAPHRRYNQFPHEMSGGMKQRVLIAIASACNPKLMIADEPTTALDVTIQAQILELLKELQVKNNMSLLIITHDLGVVSHMAKTVYVMYLGKIVESGNVNQTINNPLHPYTKGLLKSLPSVKNQVSKLSQIPHFVPHPMFKPKGCHFNNRCNDAMDICKQFMPPLKCLANGRKVRCWLYHGDKI